MIDRIKTSLHGLYVYWISSIYIDSSYCLKTYFDDFSLCVSSFVLIKTYFRFNVKNIDISFICVLDSIHTLYASKEFKYLVSVFIYV